MNFIIHRTSADIALGFWLNLKKQEFVVDVLFITFHLDWRNPDAN